MTDRPRRTTPRLGLSALELRLYLVAVLAGVYVLTFRAIGGGNGTSPSVPAAPSPVSALPPAIWLDQLPAAQRPAVVPPPGWRLASRGESAAASPAPAPVVVRAPASRPLRVRTRSS